jgi:hypothetical protein
MHALADLKLRVLDVWVQGLNLKMTLSSLLNSLVFFLNSSESLRFSSQTFHKKLSVSVNILLIQVEIRFQLEGN